MKTSTLLILGAVGYYLYTKKKAADAATSTAAAQASTVLAPLMAPLMAPAPTPPAVAAVTPAGAMDAQTGPTINNYYLDDGSDGDYYGYGPAWGTYWNGPFGRGGGGGDHHGGHHGGHH
jgi:hypothetical protein